MKHCLKFTCLLLSAVVVVKCTNRNVENFGRHCVTTFLIQNCYFRYEKTIRQPYSNIQTYKLSQEYELNSYSSSHIQGSQMSSELSRLQFLQKFTIIILFVPVARLSSKKQIFLMSCYTSAFLYRQSLYNFGKTHACHIKNIRIHMLFSIKISFLTKVITYITRKLPNFLLNTKILCMLSYIILTNINFSQFSQLYHFS